MRTLTTKYNVHLLMFEVIVQLIATISTIIISHAFEVNTINTDIVDSLPRDEACQLSACTIDAADSGLVH